MGEYTEVASANLAVLGDLRGVEPEAEGLSKVDVMVTVGMSFAYAGGGGNADILVKIGPNDTENTGRVIERSEVEYEKRK
jgi:hypothetical protein